MTPSRHDPTKTIFQQLPAVDVLHSSHVYDTFQVDSSGKVRCYHTAHIVVLRLAGRLDQSAAACFIDFAQRIISIHILTHLWIDFLVYLVAEIKRVNLNEVLKVSRHWGVALRRSLGWFVPHIERGSWNGRKRKWEEDSRKGSGRKLKEMGRKPWGKDLNCRNRSGEVWDARI